MEEKDIKVCCRYGFNVNLLIDNIECMIEDIEDGEELTDDRISYVKTRINMVRKHEKEFQRVLGIEED